MAVDLNSQCGEQLVGEIAGRWTRGVQHTDVSGEPEMKSAVARAVKEYGRLDIVQQCRPSWYGGFDRGR